MFKLYEKVSKSTENLRGVREIEDGENPFLDGPCFLCWAAQDAMTKEVFGTVKTGMKMARMRTREQLASGYDVKNFPVKFLAVKNNYSGKEPMKEFFDKYFLPLISDEGNKIHLEAAMRNMRNVNIICNCNATERVIQLEERIVNSMKEIGYSDEEISSIQSQMCVFPLETGKKLGDFKSTTISFVDTNDREVDLNVGESRRDAIKRFASESIISDTIKALSKNEAIYALAGTGEHGLKKYTREGKAMPVCISRIISNALENSIVNSRGNKFDPIDIHKLIEGVREIREGAAKGISLQDLMNKLDGELNYTGATRINELQAKDLVDMDILTDKLLAEKKNDYRVNGYKSQSSVHTQGKGLAEEEISSSVKERKIDASLKNIAFSQTASSIKNGIEEIKEEVQELENPTRDEDSSISFDD